MGAVRRPSRVMGALAAIGAGAVAAFGPALWGGRRRRDEPPLVRGPVPLLGSALPFSRNATEFLQACRAQHGDVFTIYAAGKRMTFVCDPLSYEGVLRCPALQFEPIADQIMERAFGFPNIRTTVDLERLDGFARTYLKGAHLSDISTRMSAEVFAVLQGDVGGQIGGEGGELPLYRFIWDIIFAAGTEVIFGQGMACPHAAKAFETFDRQFPALVAGMPKFMARDGVASLDALAEPFSKIGAEPSEWLSQRQTLIADLDARRRGRAQTAVLWAVHANSIPAVFWTLAHVLSSPEALRAVRRELDDTLGPEARALTVDDLARLEVIDSATREALRIATGSMTVRRATEAVRITTRSGEYAIRAGDQVCLAPQLTHHDPTVFESPEQFQYDRFLDRGDGRPRFDKDGERAGFAFLPFGAGKHDRFHQR